VKEKLNDSFSIFSFIQIYELDGTTNLYIHMLDKNHPNRTGYLIFVFTKHIYYSILESSIYSRGIAGIGQNLLCVGK
jgi:hypothetical protein